jgi:two-component system cell cycle sensor histidine kinase/response regulator CckA
MMSQSGSRGRLSPEGEILEKDASLALQNALRFNRAMLEASPMGILAYDASGAPIVVNEAAGRLVGATIDQLQRQNFRKIETWKATGLLDAAERALRTGEEVAIEVSFITTFRKEVSLDFRMVPFHYDNQLHLLTLFSDVSERKRAENALTESDQRFRQLAENIREVFWMTDPAKNKMIYISPGYEAIWERTCQSLYENPRGWIEAIHPEDRPRVLQAALTLQTTGQYNEIYRILRPDGSIRWINDRAFPIHGEAGEVYRVVGTAEDITERRDLEEQFRQAQKMEAIGLLAGGVAHDFNNLLTVINGYADIVLSSPDTSADAQEMVKEIHNAGQRATTLVRQLLTFSRKQVAQMREINLNNIITDLSKMLKRVIGENIALDLQLAPNLSTAIADPGMIEQILMNLSVNARDAMPLGGELTISTQAIRFTERDIFKCEGCRPGEFICLSVHDNGSGIAPEILPRIFEPFFTTKEPGRGTGLGLATVFGIAKQHGGWLAVESKIDHGSTFKIFLPAEKMDERKAPVKTTAAQRPPQGSETILLVEDEAAVRHVAGCALRKLGYKVFEAEDADAALKIWDERHKEIDLLFTDIIMPGTMTGRALADKIQAAAPDVKIIFSSGYSADLASRADAPLKHTLLQKPYTVQNLAETIRAVLTKKQSS